MSLRIAVACDDGPWRAWQAECLDRLAREGASILRYLGYRASPSPSPLAEGADSQALVPVPSLFASAPRSDAGSQVDAVLHFGSKPLAARQAPAAALGVWSFLFGSTASASTDPADAAGDALLRREPLLHAQLLRDGARAVRAGWYETVPHSLRQTVDAACFGAAHWPAHAARIVAAGLRLEEEPAITAPPPAMDAAARLRLRAALAARAIGARLGYLFRHEHWNVGIVRSPIAALLRGGVVRDVEWLPRPAIGRFAADPFGVPSDGGVAVLCEEFDYRDRRGYISSTFVRDGARIAAWRPVLREAQHLSYPYLVARDGTMFCVPESSEGDEVVLHEAVEFPHTWRRLRTLIPGFGGADSTLFEFEGRWWLLCTGKDEPNRALYAWHAPDLLGPWAPHARNPVKVDPRSSRPGGTPFVDGGTLYRPAQDCSGGYGRRVHLMRVNALTPSEFDEEIAATLEPDPRGPCPDGLHTLSGAGAVTLVDGKYFRFVPREFARTLAQYVTRALGSRRGPKGKTRARPNPGRSDG